MKTRCPGCETTFRATPEQIKARAGKVRCGQCQTVFNALECLLEEAEIGASECTNPPVTVPARADGPAVSDVDASAKSAAADLAVAEPLSEAAAQALAKASGLIVPRETAEIPGYSKWAEGVMSSPAVPSLGKSASWPFTLVAILLMLALSGQLIFHFRNEIAVAAPGFRPALEMLSDALGTDIPLPHHAELVSIEVSDLQADPVRSNLLILQATLRNRAAYAQAYPLLELSLTDTQDNAIARKVFQPSEYLLPQNLADQGFRANAEIGVRLWIEAREISAAGYRLYVFYP